MEIWIKAAGIVCATLLTVLMALVIKRPRVCIRIAQYVGGLALSFSGAMLLASLGAFLAKRAVLAQAVSTYAITTKSLSDDRHVLDSLEGAVDPVLGVFLGMGAISVAVVAICVGAILVARLVIEDEAEAGATKSPAKEAKGGSSD